MFSIFGLIIPDIRDLERLMFDEDDDILIAINGLPFADQLKQEVLEARECMKNNLSIAVIATLAIALETACKITLQTNPKAYNPHKDGLNDLLSNLLKNDPLSEKDRQAVLTLKG